MGKVETSSAELGPKLPNQLYNKKKKTFFFTILNEMCRSYRLW